MGGGGGGLSHLYQGNGCLLVKSREGSEVGHFRVVEGAVIHLYACVVRMLSSMHAGEKERERKGE